MAVRELPEELTRIILSKLPVKSLSRFKCVNKSWYSLIKSSHFIDLHLANRSSAGSKYDTLIVRRFHEDHNRHVLSFYSYETLDDLCNIDTPFSMRHEVVTVSGPCNGLVCMSNNHQIVICNPAIREFRSLIVPPLIGPDRKVHPIDAVAFGFDSDTCSYQVVKIGLHRVEVYDFSTDSWRKTGITVPIPFRYPGYAFSLNGVFHCYLECRLGGVNAIFSFRISNKVTQLIPLPNFCSFRDVDLSVLNESLALIVCDQNLMEGCYEVWVMTEYGVKESWTRLFTLGPLWGMQFPLAFWKNDELLFESDNRHLVSCNLQHQKLKYFPIRGVHSFPGSPSSFSVLPYFESLVSVNAINKKGDPA